MWEVKTTSNEFDDQLVLLDDWEPFAVDRESTGPVIYCRRQVKPEGQKIQDEWKAKLMKGKLTMNVEPTPEGQKIQDEPDVGVGARMRLALERNHQKVAAQIDHEILTAPEAAAIRAQAIKDVARWLRIHGLSPYVTGYRMNDLENGKIPE